SYPPLEDTAPRIVEHPTDLLVSKGEPATLSCKAEGRPSPAVEWYKDGERVETDREDPRSHRTLLPGGSLFFLRILHGRRGKPDEGVYVCVARNYLGEATSRNASLEVAVLRDDFRQPPGDVVVAAGEPAVLECVPPRGHPEPSVSWKKDGARLSDRDERLTIRGGKLMLASTRKSDAGVYVCVATNVVGERDSEPAELVVFERPAFGKRPLNQAVLVEGTAEFPCEVLGDPRPAARWRKEDGEMPPGRWEVLPDNTLRLRRLRPEDEGTYTCVADNSVGRSEASGTLTVHVPPQLITGPRDQTVSPGQSVTFQCQSKGNPPPAVFWQKEGSQTLLFPGQPSPSPSRVSVSPGGAITITEVQPSDAGSYQCQAISVAGSVLAKARLRVAAASAEHFPPPDHRDLANRTVLPVGTTAWLPCRVGDGDPPGSMRWLKDGSVLVGAEPRINLLENGTLEISELRVSRPGAGAQGTHPPRAPGGQECGVQGCGCKVGWVLKGWWVQGVVGARDGGCKGWWVQGVVDARGGGFKGNMVSPWHSHLLTSVEVPTDPPPSPILGRSKPHTARAGPRSGPTGAGTSDRAPPGAPFVQGFRVLCRRRGGRWEEARAGREPAERGALLTELRRGQDYEVKVRAYFRHLQGPDSAVRALRTPEAAPSAPPRAVSVAGNGTSVRISWQPPPPAEQNGVIRDYRIWCLGNESRFHINQSVEGTVLATVLRGLVPGVPYRAEVAAATGAGVGIRAQPLHRYWGVLPVGPPPYPWHPSPLHVPTAPLFAASFAYTPTGKPLGAAGTRRGPSSPSPSPLSTVAFPAPARGSPSAGYPWLADTWRGAGSGGGSGVAATACLGTTERYYNDAGISRYIAQTEQFGAGAGEGPVYSTIEVGAEELHTFPRPFSHHGTPYPGGGPQPMDVPTPQAPRGWTEQGRTGAKGKRLGQAVKPPVVSWTELLPPPPSASELSQCTQEEEEEEEE
ncbi:Roundabout 2, partial [Dryobates pubescens]